MLPDIVIDEALLAESTIAISNVASRVATLHSSARSNDYYSVLRHDAPSTTSRAPEDGGMVSSLVDPFLEYYLRRAQQQREHDALIKEAQKQYLCYQQQQQGQRGEEQQHLLFNVPCGTIRPSSSWRSTPIPIPPSNPHWRSSSHRHQQQQSHTTNSQKVEEAVAPSFLLPPTVAPTTTNTILFPPPPGAPTTTNHNMITTTNFINNTKDIIMATTTTTGKKRSPPYDDGDQHCNSPFDPFPAGASLLQQHIQKKNKRYLDCADDLLLLAQHEDHYYRGEEDDEEDDADGEEGGLQEEQELSFARSTKNCCNNELLCKGGKSFSLNKINHIVEKYKQEVERDENKKNDDTDTSRTTNNDDEVGAFPTTKTKKKLSLLKKSDEEAQQRPTSFVETLLPITKQKKKIGTSCSSSSPRTPDPSSHSSSSSSQSPFSNEYLPLLNNHKDAMLRCSSRFGLSFPIPTKCSYSLKELKETGKRLRKKCKDNPKGDRYVEAKCLQTRQKKQKEVIEERVSAPAHQQEVIEKVSAPPAHDSDNKCEEVIRRPPIISRIDSDSSLSSLEDLLPSMITKEEYHHELNKPKELYEAACEDHESLSSSSENDQEPQSQPQPQPPSPPLSRKASCKCCNCKNLITLGGVLVDVKSNRSKEYMDDLYSKKHFQLTGGYRMVERDHIDAILENGKKFGVTFPIPTKFHTEVERRPRITRRKDAPTR